MDSAEILPDSTEPMAEITSETRIQNVPNQEMEQESEKVPQFMTRSQFTFENSIPIGKFTKHKCPSFQRV